MQEKDTTTYTGPERRSRIRERQWRNEVDRRFADGSEKMNRLHDELKANTTATLRVQDDTSELVSLLNSVKGAFKVLDVLGKAARPLGYIATAAVAVLGFFGLVKGGGGGQ